MHPIALASGVVPGLTPQDTARAAAEGGFDAVGIWVEPDKWTATTSVELRGLVGDNGLSVIDVEVIWIRPGPLDPDHLRILDIGLEIAAANALVVSSDPDIAATTEKFARLCEHVRDGPLRVALEFGIFTDVKSIVMAQRIIAEVDHPIAALLVDAIHLDRSGGCAADVASLPRDWLSYTQLCDATADRPAIDDFDAIIDDAVFRRKQLGEGVLEIGALVAALPANIPVSVELRSQELYDRYPDPVKRAKAVAETTRAYLASITQR